MEKPPLSKIIKQENGGGGIKWILLQFQKEVCKFQLLIFPLEISACIFIYYKHMFMTRIILVFYIQIKYFLFIYSTKMIWVPALCQTAVHLAFTGCTAQWTKNNWFHGAYKLVKADRQYATVAGCWNGTHSLVFISCTEVQEYSNTGQYAVRKTETSPVTLTERI